MKRTFSIGLAANVVGALAFGTLALGMHELMIGDRLTHTSRPAIWVPALLVGGVLGLWAQHLKDRRLAAGDALRTEYAGASFLDAIRSIADGERQAMTLYLRPFVLTNQLKFGNPAASAVPRPLLIDDEQDIERAIAEAVESDAMLVGLGRPGEHQGAGRIVVSDAHWQDAVRVLAAAAERVVLIPYPTEGTLWEVDYVLGAGLRSKTIIVMPPAPPEALADLAGRWTECCSIVRQRHGIELPPYHKDGALLVIGADGRVASSPGFPLWQPGKLGRALATLSPRRSLVPVDDEVRTSAKRLAGELGLLPVEPAAANVEAAVPPHEPAAALAITSTLDALVQPVTTGRLQTGAAWLAAAIAVLGAALVGEPAPVPEPAGLAARRLLSFRARPSDGWSEADLSI